MPGTSTDDTRLTSLAVAEIGNGLLSPYEGMPLAALGNRASANGLSDDFTFYKGPLAAATADGYTVGITTGGVISIDVTNANGAGVLDFSLPGIGDAVSLETERALIEFGAKAVKGVVKLQPENMTDSDLHFGFGTVGVVHGTADSADMAEVKWDAALQVIELRTQKDTGGVTTTAASAALSAQVAANTGAMQLGIIAKADGTVAAVVSLNDGARWSVVATLAAGDASLPVAGDPMGMYVAAVGVVATTDVDVDYWSMTYTR